MTETVSAARTAPRDEVSPDGSIIAFPWNKVEREFFRALHQRMAGRYTGSYPDQCSGWRAVAALADIGQASLVDVDPASLKSLRNEQLSCPECKGLHEFSEIWSWVTDEGSPDPDNVTA